MRRFAVWRIRLAAPSFQNTALHFDAQTSRFFGRQDAARQITIHLGQLVAVDDQVFSTGWGSLGSSPPQGLQQNHGHHDDHSAR